MCVCVCVCVYLRERRVVAKIFRSLVSRMPVRRCRQMNNTGHVRVLRVAAEAVTRTIRASVAISARQLRQTPAVGLWLGRCQSPRVRTACQSQTKRKRRRLGNAAEVSSGTFVKRFAKRIFSSEPAPPPLLRLIVPGTIKKGMYI